MPLGYTLTISFLEKFYRKLKKLSRLFQFSIKLFSILDKTFLKNGILLCALRAHVSKIYVNFLLIMMWNVSCLCKKLQIWDMGFCHCWISLRNIVKDLQKTQVEYCWIRPKLAFWCYFSFPSTWSMESNIFDGMKKNKIK